MRDTKYLEFFLCQTDATQHQAVSFEGLKPNTEYRYAVVVTYDALDGKGFDVHTLYSKEFNTYPALSFSNLEITQTEVSFVLAWNSQIKDTTMTALALYQNGTPVKELALDARKIENLLSNTTYELVAEYLLNGVSERCSISFTTKENGIITYSGGGYGSVRAFFSSIGTE